MPGCPTTAERRTWLSRFLAIVERGGNALPHPATLFALMAFAVILVATMLPYSMTFLVGWTVLLIVWITAGLPVGPGAGLYLPQP